MKLRVIEPCEEGWENMEPRRGGRFCERCDRTVVDFTRLSVAQAAARVRSARGRLCGHALVHSETMEAVLRPSPPTPRLLGGLLVGASLAAGCAGQAPESAATPVAQTPIPAPADTVMEPLDPAALAAIGPALRTRAVALPEPPRDAAPTAEQRARTARKRAHLQPAAATPAPLAQPYVEYDGMMDVEW